MSTSQHQKDRYVGGASRPRERGPPGVGGMVTLGGTAKRTKAGPKLAVPKPVNLPSLKKEHAGTISTALASRGQGWSGEDELHEVGDVQASLIEKATWAGEGTGQRPASGPQPPSWRPASVFNPYEFPSLGDEPQARPTITPLTSSHPGNWDEDERAGPGFRPESRGSRSHDFSSRASEEDMIPGDYHGNRAPSYRHWRGERPPYWEEEGRGRGYGEVPRGYGEGPRGYGEGPRGHGTDSFPPHDASACRDRYDAYWRPNSSSEGYARPNGRRSSPSDQGRWSAEVTHPRDNWGMPHDGLFPPAPPPPPPRRAVPREDEAEPSSKLEVETSALLKETGRDEERDAFHAELQRMAQEMKEAELRAKAGVGADAAPAEDAHMTAAAVVAGAVPAAPSMPMPSISLGLGPSASGAAPDREGVAALPSPAQTAVLSYEPPSLVGPTKAQSPTPPHAPTAVSSSVGSTSSLPPVPQLGAGAPEVAQQQAPSINIVEQEATSDSIANVLSTTTDETPHEPVQISTPVVCPTPGDDVQAARPASRIDDRPKQPVVVSAALAQPRRTTPNILRRPVAIPVSTKAAQSSATTQTEATTLAQAQPKEKVGPPRPSEEGRREKKTGSQGGRRGQAVVEAVASSEIITPAERATNTNNGPKSDRASGRKSHDAGGPSPSAVSSKGGKSGSTVPESNGDVASSVVVVPPPPPPPPRTVMGTKSWRAVLSGIPDEDESAAGPPSKGKGKKSEKKKKEKASVETTKPAGKKKEKERKKERPPAQTAILTRPATSKGGRRQTGTTTAGAAELTVADAANATSEPVAPEGVNQGSTADDVPADSSLTAPFTWSLPLADEMARLHLGGGTGAPEEPLGPAALQLLPSLGSDLGLGDDAPSAKTNELGVYSGRRDNSIGAEVEPSPPAHVVRESLTGHDPFALPGGASSLFGPLPAAGASNPMWMTASGSNNTDSRVDDRGSHLLPGGFFMGNDSSANAVVSFGAVPYPAPGSQETSASGANNGAEYGAVMAAFGALNVHGDMVGHPQNEMILRAGGDDARYLSDAMASQPAPLTPAVGWAPTGLPPDWSSPQSRAGSGSAPSREGIGRSSLGAQPRAKQRRDSASLDPAASLPDDVFDETSPLAAPPVLNPGNLLLPPTFYYHQHAFGPSSSGLMHAPVTFGQAVNLGPTEMQLGARTTTGQQVANPPNNQQSGGATRPVQQPGRGYAARGGHGRGGRASRGRGGFGQASRQPNAPDSTAPGATGQAVEKAAVAGPKREGSGRGGGPSRWRGGRQRNGNKGSNNNNGAGGTVTPPVSTPASAF